MGEPFGPGPTSTVNEVDFTHTLKAAPYAWLGYTGDQGFGVRLQWFQFNDGATAAGTADGTVITGVVTPMIGGVGSVAMNPGDALAVSQTIALQVIDLEGTKAINFSRGSCLLSAGVRYAHLAQTYNSALTDIRSTLVETLGEGHNFNGAGPTMGVLGRFPIPYFPQFGIYARARGAVLFGQRHQDVQLIDFGVIQEQLLVTGHSVIPMSELEAGIDWNYNWGRSRFFLQTGVMAQTWFGAGNPAYSTAFSVFPMPGLTTPVDNSNLTLMGIRATAGVNF
jgi:hypothetical protein